MTTCFTMHWPMSVFRCGWRMMGGLVFEVVAAQWVLENGKANGLWGGAEFRFWHWVSASSIRTGAETVAGVIYIISYTSLLLTECTEVYPRSLL